MEMRVEVETEAVMDDFRLRKLTEADYEEYTLLKLRFSRRVLYDPMEHVYYASSASRSC
jgi:hypothetical protein